MSIGDLLVALDLLTPADLDEVFEHQASHGGPIEDSLTGLGKIGREDLDAILATVPVSPKSVADTGLPLTALLNLLIKALYAANLETATAVSELMRLPPRIVLELLAEAEHRQLLSVLGNERASLSAERRYVLTLAGMEWAHAAMRQNEYVGPTPVPLADYCRQIGRQRIANEHIVQDEIDRAFSDLVVTKGLVTKLGPAVNSSRSILLFGPPGNGKTSVARRLGGLLSDIIYVPHAFEVDGQIIKVFDPEFHKSVERDVEPGLREPVIRREDFDGRWEACRRPVIFTGGELTLEMLDLGYIAEAKYYEAPLHIKAMGGVFLIDDFGRQLVKPTDLLNRWIVPLENKVDYLKLHSGKSFCLPFDELVIFSTNLEPKDLMDPAFLRRIPYKIEIGAPEASEFRRIFKNVAIAAGLGAPDKLIESVICSTKAHRVPLARYQPKFIIDQVIAACRFARLKPQFQGEFLKMALSNLFTDTVEALDDATQVGARPVMAAA
ncbi:MAG TPA: hypothetical protein VIF38_00240 [Burkholderiales bacterium]|jgi:hypothetical protein